MATNKKTKSKIEKSWDELFQKFNIPQLVAQHGYFDISSADIKSAKGKPEPRLMCKMDFSEKVPQCFTDNELSILAIANGVYRIASTTPFFEIDETTVNSKAPIDVFLPNEIDTIDVNNITSESQALDAAVASGMLDQLLGEKSYLTVRGRKYSNEFSLELPSNTANSQSIRYDIKSVQIEVDGGYEGPSILALIEAKMGTSTNMNMRQLIYPHKHFESYLGKEIKTYVMFYQTGSIFTFIPMSITQSTCELEYQNATKFHLRKDTSKTKNIIVGNLPKPGHDAPFPQADDFEKVLFGFFKLAETPGTETEIFSDLPITPRQYNYYFNALKWLGLAQKDGRGKPITLTSLGQQLINLDDISRIKALKHIVESNKVVQHILQKPNEPLPFALKEKSGLKGPSMYPRRRSTIFAWLKYFEKTEQNLT